MTIIHSVTKPDIVSDPSYSPDGTTVVFVEKLSSTYKISTLLLDDSTYTVLQSGPDPYADPYYSADGFFIVYAKQTSPVSGPEPYGQWSLHYMSSDGTGDTTILDDGNANMHPTWATPTQIAFQSWENGISTAFQVSLIDLAGQGRIDVGEGEYPRTVTA